MHALSERAVPTTVFPNSFLGPYLQSARCARLTAPFHLYLALYAKGLGVTRLLLILSICGSTFSYAHATSSSPCVRVFDV